MKTLPAVNLSSILMIDTGGERRAELFAVYSGQSAEGETWSGTTAIHKGVTSQRTVLLNRPISHPSRSPWHLLTVEAFESDGPGRTAAILEQIGKVGGLAVAKTSISAGLPVLQVAGGVLDFVHRLRGEPDYLGGGSFYVTAAGLVEVGAAPGMPPRQLLTLPPGTRDACASIEITTQDLGIERKPAC